MIRKIVALWLGTLVGCGGGSDLGPNPATVGRVTVNPAGLTLPVGGQGTLTAEVRDADDAIVSNASVTWSSLNSAVAAVTGNGTVTGHVIGETQVIAAAGDKADTADVLVIDELTLEVDPAAASVAVGGTVQFTVTARNGSGQVIPAPPVAWASSNTAVGTINAGGVATGVAPGQIGITASAGAVTSPPATLTVNNDQAAACDGIATVSAFDGSLDYDYAVTGDDESGRRIDAEYHGRLTAQLTHMLPGGPVFETWQGPLEGTGTVHETQTDPTTGDTDRFEAEGPILQSIAGVFQSVMQLIVNVTTCTYMLTVNPALHVTHFEFGTRREADEQVVQVQIGSNTALGAWKALNSIAGLDLRVDGHPVFWAGLHPDQDAFSPLGLANGLFSADAEAPVGSATVSYLLGPK
jgi:plastocyanin